MPDPVFIPLGETTAENKDFIPLEPTGSEKPLQNRPDDTSLTGTLKNAGTSAIKGVSHIPGFAGDLRSLSDYLVMRAHSAASGVPMEELQKRRQGLQQQMTEATPSFLRTPQVPSGEDISGPILEKTGEYQPTTEWGRLGAAASETGLSMLGPGGLAGGLKAARSGAGGLDIARRVLTGAPKAVPIGAASGAASEAVTDFTGEPLAGLATGIAVPGVAGLAKAGASKYVRPFRPGQQQPMADERLLANTKDPDAAVAKLSGDNEIVPGSNPSTAEITSDQGHVIADKLAAARDPQYLMAKKAREAEQNSARRKQFEKLADLNANPADVSEAFRSHLEQIETDHESRVNGAHHKATSATGSIQGIEPEEVGKSLRGELSDANKARQGYFSKAYNALDPEKDMHLVATPVAEAAKNILESPNRDMALDSPLANKVLSMATQLKGVESFERLREFDKTLTKAISQAKIAQDPGYNDIRSLKGAVKDAFSQAVENQVKWEQQAVARGDMRVEDTFAHKLREQVESYYADKERAAAGESSGADGAVRQSGFSPASGKAGRPVVPGSDEGTPKPNLTPDTAQRLSDVNKEYGEYRSLYGTAPLSKALETNGFKDQFKLPDSKVINSAFPKGDGGYEAASTWMRGANNSPQSISDMKSIAVSKLRDGMKGDTLDPATLDAWKKNYAAGLRALEEVSPGFTKQFDNAASATDALNRSLVDQKQAIGDAKKGVAAKFLGLKDADDVTALIGRAMSSPNSGQQISELVGRLKGNPAAMAGAKRAGIDWLLGRTSNAGVTSADEHILSGPKIVNLVRDNPSAIKTLYGADGLAYMRNVVKDMERAQKLQSLQATAGSDTASKLLGRMIDDAVAHESSHGTTIGGALNFAALLEMFHGEFLHAGLLTGAKMGLEKAAHMISHRRGQGLAEVNRMFMEGLDDPKIGRAMLQRAMDAKGQPNYDAFTKLAAALGVAENEQRHEERHGRASGGKVGDKIDYVAKATELLKLAQKAKKAHGDSSKPLLKVPDQLIASALKLAQERPING